jgi:hypothetical protein
MPCALHPPFFCLDGDLRLTYGKVSTANFERETIVSLLCANGLVRSTAEMGWNCRGDAFSPRRFDADPTLSCDFLGRTALL